MVNSNQSTGVDAVLNNDIASFDPTKRFKCIKLIHSTAIAAAPLTATTLKPVKDVAKYSIHDHDLHEQYSQENPIFLCMMITLHPNRRALLLDI